MKRISSNESFPRNIILSIDSDENNYRLNLMSFRNYFQDALGSGKAPQDAVEIATEKLERLVEKRKQVFIPKPGVKRDSPPLKRELEERVKKEKPELLPQLILIDGNGILHSNRFGLACHLGVLSDIPTVGCGKTVFNVDGISKIKVKKEAKKLVKAGDYNYLKGTSGSIWGAALKCTEKSTDPLIVSVGHKVSLDTAINIVTNSCRFRVPEPIRIADLRSRHIIKKYDYEQDTFDILDFFEKLKLNIHEDNI
jgi:hypothetical protein